MVMRRRISQGPCRSTPWYISQYIAKQTYNLPPTPVNSKQHTTSYLHLSTPTHHNSCRFKSLKLKILVPDFYLLPSSTVKRRETDIAGSRRSTSWFISENPPQRTCDIFYHSIKIITFTLFTQACDIEDRTWVCLDCASPYNLAITPSLHKNSSPHFQFTSHLTTQSCLLATCKNKLQVLLNTDNSCNSPCLSLDEDPLSY